MKTRLYYPFIFLLLLAFSACKDAAQVENQEINKSPESEVTDSERELEVLKKYLDTPVNFQTSIPTKFNFCETTEAILPKNRYNRTTGIANFSIPMPKGSNLRFKTMSKDTLIFVCDGNGKVTYGANDLFIYQKTVTALTRGDYNKKLWVSVEFTNFKNNECTTMDPLRTKKKTSEVTGSPK